MPIQVCPDVLFIYNYTIDKVFKILSLKHLVRIIIDRIFTGLYVYKCKTGRCNRTIIKKLQMLKWYSYKSKPTIFTNVNIRKIASR